MNPADIPPDKKEIIAKIEKAFLESRFIFQADHKCVFDFSFEEIAVRNGYWNYNNNSSTITIQDWEGKDNGALLLGLQVFVNEDKIYFMVERLPFVLEVEKI